MPYLSITICVTWFALGNEASGEILFSVPWSHQYQKSEGCMLRLIMPDLLDSHPWLNLNRHQLGFHFEISIASEAFFCRTASSLQRKTLRIVRNCLWSSHHFYRYIHVGCSATNYAFSTWLTPTTKMTSQFFILIIIRNDYAFNLMYVLSYIQSERKRCFSWGCESKGVFHGIPRNSSNVIVLVCCYLIT